MAQCTLDPDRFEGLSSLIEKASHAHDCIGLEQQQRIGRIVQIDFAGFDGAGDNLRHRLHINFQTEFERLFRAHPWSHPTQLFALDRLMKLNLPTPEILAPERIVPKRMHAFRQQPLDIVADGVIEGWSSRGRSLPRALLRGGTVIVEENSKSRENED